MMFGGGPPAPPAPPVWPASVGSLGIPGAATGGFSPFGAPPPAFSALALALALLPAAFSSADGPQPVKAGAKPRASPRVIARVDRLIVASRVGPRGEPRRRGD